MQIGELAQQCGVSVDTVRYYEKQQLLLPTGRSTGGYRQFGQQAKHQLSFIIKAKALGFTLKEIKELLTIKISPDSFECAEVKAMADAKLERIESKIKELQHMHQALTHISGQCCGGNEPATGCSIIDLISRDGSL
ncbi:MAG: Zn(2+)-responsive transcriptional regulator [Neptuniibacter caesariensis]|uniref:Zn(2+)-responsive transcriptional regulator n=1 Tax=Neptuniibacter caesariensis TaxID=207954 RepID=A0A2G6JNN4_NEPCE|nr:MAG: Zn(2+)-responsive transcriptional regulator [Neptuniibacter caesariensis]